MYRYKILIVDDDKLLQNSLKNVLSEKYDTLVVGRGEDALELLRKHPVDLVLLDVRLPGQDGIETLQQIKALERELMVIMMTAYEDVKTVITSMKMGAHDYLVKPLEIEELEIIVEKALDNLKLKKEVEELRKNYLKEFNVGNIIGESPAIKQRHRVCQQGGQRLRHHGAHRRGDRGRQRSDRQDHPKPQRPVQ